MIRTMIPRYRVRKSEFGIIIQLRGLMNVQYIHRNVTIQLNNIIYNWVFGFWFFPHGLEYVSYMYIWVIILNF